MANAKIQTTENNNSVSAFIKKVPDVQKQKDSMLLIDIMKEISGFPAKMWGPAIVGFGSCHYKYESGREGDMPIVAFSPRKQSLTLYLCSKFDKRDELLKNFGKHTTSVACIYVKKLADIDIAVLKKLIAGSIKQTKASNK